MRILLAGGAGAIGRQLTPALVAAGHDVWATSRAAAKAGVIAAGGAHPLVMDVYDRDSVKAAFAASRPDAVLHELTDLAGYDLAANARIRVEGTERLLDAARRYGVDRVITQSISWVVPDGNDLATESEPLTPGHMPGVVALEEAVLGLEAGVVLRYGQFYGPGTWRTTAPGEDDPRDVVAAREGTLRPLADWTDFVHVADAASATVLALDWPRGIVNVVDDEPARAADWMPVFAAAVGAPAAVVPNDLPQGRPVSNALARGRGWNLRFPSWRDGFTSPDGGVAR